MTRHSKRPLIMGILNVTSDSFSDGGDYPDVAAAVTHAICLVEEGADIIDIGGESTRPGAARISASVQIDRVVPVIEELKKRLSGDISISVDTTLAKVADAAISAGAIMINDVSAGRDDPELFGLAASRKASLVLMHMQGTPSTMQDNPVYADVVEEVYQFLLERIAAARSAGIQDDRIIIDPGIGFGKTLEHNIDILNKLSRFTDSRYPVMLGASRKRFLKTICKGEHNVDLAGATCATTAMGVLAGVSIFRVHDVRENRQTADVIHRIIENLSAGTV